jgi:hypothetical protein
MVTVERKVVSYLGIDPGKSGGMVLLSGNTTISLKMPATPKDLLDSLRELQKKGVVHAVMESVGGYAGKAHPGSAMFNFGKGVGHLEMALLSCSIPFDTVPPRTWQKALGISTRKKTESKTQWKNRLKTIAQRLYPSEKITLATSDAYLLATYCKRKKEGSL